jgi:predicted Zn-dependent peptidase
MLCACALLPAQDVKEFEKHLTDFTLPNGLEFVVVERHDSPIVSFHTYTRAGTADDPAGRTGLANLMERVWLTGSETIGTKGWAEERKALDAVEEAYDAFDAERGLRGKASQDRLDRLEAQLRMAVSAADRYGQPEAYGAILASSGARPLLNATPDATEFSYGLASNRLELWFLMESQRLMHPAFRDFYNARAVAEEEDRQLALTRPEQPLLAAFSAAAFQAVPYRNPQQGWPGDTASLRRSDAKAFYEKYCVPGNTTIAIVGDVNPAEVKAMAQRYFGAWPARPVPPPPHTDEPVSRGPRTVVVESPVQRPLLALGYRRPNQFDKDDLVFDILQFALTQGRSGLLTNELITDNHLALTVQAFATYPAGAYASQFVFLVSAAQGHTAEENQKAIEDFLNKLKLRRLDDDVMNRARTLARSTLINRLASNAGLAQILATYQGSYGDWHRLFTTEENLDKVTAEDLQKVLVKYFVPTARTVAYTVPPGQSGAPARPTPATGGKQ